MIQGNQLRDMFISGAHNITNHKEEINALNVFPVPDGDTGTNMSMTITAAEKEMTLHADKSAGEIASLAASALLKGARGNSGVILSLLFRGFAKGLAGCENATAQDIANGFTKGVDAAYKAVMKPTEGTILTVARVAAEKTAAFVGADTTAKEALDFYIEKAKETLDTTPKLLPVLAQAGVVDAGGKGFLTILEGMAQYLATGEIVAAEDGAEAPAVTMDFADFDKFDTEDITFTYCTEYIVQKDTEKKKKISALRSYLESIGDCVVAVEDEEIIKVHVHTNHPGRAIEEALGFGMIATLKVENMKLQHEAKLAEKTAAPKEKKPFAFVSVCAGDGITEVFRDLGVDGIVGGGQTMNPSTEDILEAVESAPSDVVFVLPNNKNIIMSAQSCVEMTDKNVIVIPTRTIPQGVAAMIGFNPDADVEENEQSMLESALAVKTAHVTYAARDSVFDDKKIKQGQLLGLLENKVSFVEDEMDVLLEKLISSLATEDTSFICLYYGEDITEEQAEAAKEKVAALVPDAEVEVVAGGQPVYHYIISVE